MALNKADLEQPKRTVVPQDEGEQRRVLEDATRFHNPGRRLDAAADRNRLARTLVVHGD